MRVNRTVQICAPDRGHSLLPHFQLHWTRHRTHRRIIILIDPRSKSARPNRILRPQPELQFQTFDPAAIESK